MLVKNALEVANMVKDGIIKPHGTICLDFDAVLHEYHGFDGVEPTGPPTEGALEAVKLFQSMGLTVVIHSCRANYEGGIEAIYAWLGKHYFPKGIKVVIEKPGAEWYVDDRAIRFRGNWDEVIEAMKEKPWYKTQKKDTV